VRDAPQQDDAVDGDLQATMSGDAAVIGLARLAALVAVAREEDLRSALAGAQERLPHEWIEEMILQSYLFAGFPRTLNAAREWRRISGRAAPARDPDAESGDTTGWRERGEDTCRTVYGRFYEPLRRNIRALHPALDSWMITEGYGKVLARPGLPLAVRELCIVAVCAAAGQDRQLHSHLHGALNAGATPEAVEGVLESVADLMHGEDPERYRLLWTRVLNGREARA
jgi:4-carboxymuconolactone decarboxylase